MTNKELRKLSRENLLEIMVEQQKRIEDLEDQVDRLSAALNERQIAISEAGNIAEASLRISKVFEAAQLAADAYLDNVKRISGISQAEPQGAGSDFGYGVRTGRRRQLRRGDI